MRALCLSLALTGACLCGHTVMADLIRHVQTQALPANNFKSIPEYFSGGERYGGRLVLRTAAHQRAGFYFVLTLERKIGELPPGAFTLEIIDEGQLQLRTYRFPATDREPAAKEVLLGLTGKATERPPQRRLLAWRLRYIADDGEILATATSFLWPGNAQRPAGGGS